MKRNRLLAVALSLSMLWGEVSSGVSFIKHGITALAAESKANHYSLVEKTSAMKYKGDVNGDGKITDDDKTLLQKWLVHMVNDSELDLEKADLNLDGEVTIRDFVELSILCGSTQISDGEGEYENVYTPEPRARVICNTKENNKEKIETKMTEEMADLVDHLKTPLAVYEYLYNNLNTEYYIGSRKGAIGAYEQKGGNDVDCSSLLIAMLRYLGYDAEYVTGTIGVTEKQLLEFTGTDSIDDALNIIGIHSNKISKSSNYYYFTHTWVRTVINSESYDLDISLKKYKQVLSLNDAAENVNNNYSSEELLDLTNISGYQNLFNDEMSADPNSEFSFSGRAIVQKAIKELPVTTNFIVANETEIVSDICNSKTISRDKVTFTVSGESKDYDSSELYVNDLTIGYTFNPYHRELWGEEYYDFALPGSGSIYDLGDKYWYQGVRLDTSPAIYINNKIAYTWNIPTPVGDSNDLKITVFSSGRTLVFNKTIDSGSINAFKFDFQNISAQEIMTSQANMPSEEDIGKIDVSKYRDSDCLKNYLTLMGTMFFSECDVQDKMISSALDVRQEKYLSFGIFSYNADVNAVNRIDVGETFEDTGSFEVDILDNTYIQKSYTGNADDEKSFHFMSGLALSYLESEILEQFTEEEAVSTVSILETAMDMDIPIICINSQNIGVLNNLSLYDADKTIIREAVKTGAYVTIPEKNIKIGNWTGVGYIVQNDSTDDLSFKITGALNGGSTVNKATQEALQKYALICGSVAFVDTVSALYSAVMMLNTAAMTLTYATTAMGVIGGLVTVVASFAIMSAAIDGYKAAVTNCFLVLEGDPDAALELLIDTELTIIVNVLGALGGLTAKAIKNKIAKNYIKKSLPEELVPDIYKTFKGQEESVAKYMKKAKLAGIDTDSLTKLLRDSGCIDKYPQKVLKQLGKLEKEAQWAIIDGIEKCPKDLPDLLKNLDKKSLGRFFKTASKNTDEIFEGLAKSTNTKGAVDLLAEYGEQGLKTFNCSETVQNIVRSMKNSDEIIEAINNSHQTSEEITKNFENISNHRPNISADEISSLYKASLKTTTRALDAAGDAADAAIKSEVLEFRKLLGEIKTSSNIGYAQTQIKGVTEKIFSVAYFEDLDEAVKYGATIDTNKYHMAWRPEESTFTAFKAANPNGGDLYMRTACTEYKILSEIERQIKNTPNISGKIRLFTERKCCDSCSDVIAQFLERHTNIEIEIIHNNDKVIKK